MNDKPAKLRPWSIVMLDSGAYSAWRQNDPIKLDDYITFCVKYRQFFDTVVNLDVIPAGTALHHTDEAADQGYKNLKQMMKAGLSPVHVFHAGERRYWLDKLLDTGLTYIGLGGRARVGEVFYRRWVDEIFDYLCGKSGFPSIKIHGFGMTSIRLMLSYPWYSVDSTSWFMQGANGSVFIPKNGKYDVAPVSVAFTRQQRNADSHNRTADDRHFDKLGTETKRYIETYLQDNGTDLKTMQDSYYERIRMNAKFFTKFVQNHTPTPFRPSTRQLFEQSSGHGQATSLGFRLNFAVGTYLPYVNILKDAGVRTHLMSYHSIALRGPARYDWRHYILTGRLKIKEPKK